jgi:hypothetical protein
MRKIVYSTLVLVALSGCATHQQANTAVGAGTGAIIGNALGGRGGAAVGALMGASIGSQQPTQRNIIVERQIVHPAAVRPDYSVCNQWSYQEREACFRGADARAQQEQNRRNQEAYRQGLGR